MNLEAACELFLSIDPPTFVDKGGSRYQFTEWVRKMFSLSPVRTKELRMRQIAATEHPAHDSR